jgi:hypothetical protein
MLEGGKLISKLNELLVLLFSTELLTGRPTVSVFGGIILSSNKLAELMMLFLSVLRGSMVFACSHYYDFYQMLEDADAEIFKNILCEHYCLFHFLPTFRCSDRLLRKSGHNF